MTFLFPEIATAISLHVHSLLSWVKISSLPLGMIPLVCLIDSIIKSRFLHNLFLLILVHAHTIVHCLILPLLPCICSSALCVSCVFIPFLMHVVSVIGFKVVTSYCF